MEIGAAPDVENFVGTDPDDVVHVDVGKARFAIGPMPAFMWEKLNARHTVAAQNARRRAIKAFADEGRDAEELAFPDTAKGDGTLSTLTKLDIQTAGDPEFQEEQKKVQLECARWSVRGHERFVRRDGTTFELDLEETFYDGVPYKVLGPKLLGVLRVNTRILDLLWYGIRALNDLGVSAKKA